MNKLNKYTDTNINENEIGKRPYIEALDGFRALAIILVLIFHIDKSLLQGGFVGVDIFFTISGYIITLNLVNLANKGNFKFVDFYHRRVTRLLPAVSVLVIATLALSYFIYSPEVQSEFARSGLYSIISVANIYYWLGSGYFDDVSQGNVFLHMWSLSVEEQFYIIWPFAIIGILFFKRSLSIIIGISIVSLLGAYCIYTASPSAAFYLMPARAFQFALGALVAFLHLRPALSPSSRFKSHRLRNGGFLLGVALILLSAATSSGDQYNFWMAAVLPVTGAAIGILCVHAPFARLLFGAMAVRGVGLRAYSIYLVHWPVIVFASAYFGMARSIAVNAAILAACLVLAEVLHRLVERPLRLKSGAGARLNGVRTAVTILLLTGGIVFAAHVWVTRSAVEVPMALTATEAVQRPGRPPTLTFPNARDYAGSYTRYAGGLWADRARYGRTDLGCQLPNDGAVSDFNVTACVEGSASRHVLVIGDSFAAEALMMLSRVYDEESLLIAGTAGCLPIFPEPGHSNRTPACQTLNTHRFEWAAREDIAVIALTSNWRYWADHQIASTLDYLVGLGKPVILLGVRPIFEDRIPALLDGAFASAARNDLERYASYDFRQKNREVAAVAARFGRRVTYVDLLELMCTPACEPFNAEDALVYLDNAHVTADAAFEIGDRINAAQGLALRQLHGASSQTVATSSSSPASAAFTLRMRMACGPVGDLPGFERALVAEVRAGRFSLSNGEAGSQGYERWTGAVGDDGVIAVRGEYIEGPGGTKTAAFELTLQGDRIAGEGQRGLRQCVIEGRRL